MCKHENALHQESDISRLSAQIVTLWCFQHRDICKCNLIKDTLLVALINFNKVISIEIHARSPILASCPANYVAMLAENQNDSAPDS